MVSKIYLSVVICLSLASIGVTNGDKSLTTSKTNGVRRSHMSGELIFSDEFDQLDFDKWQHELTMSGGGNWEFQVDFQLLGLAKSIQLLTCLYHVDLGLLEQSVQFVCEGLHSSFEAHLGS